MSAPERDRPVGLDAIAKSLGVSRTTVHYALTRKGRVSEAVRKRVLEAANQMGYRPNLLARSLRTRQTHTLGVIFSSLTSSFHAHLLETIDRTAQDSGYGILFACSYRDAAKERQLIDMLLRKGVDGLIIAPVGHGQDSGAYAPVIDSGIPAVFVDRDAPTVNADCVAVDNFLGGRMAGEHFLALGRKSPAFLTIAHRGHEAPTLLSRLHGFNYALEVAGAPPAAVLTVEASPQVTGESGAYDAIAHALSANQFHCDSLFTANDNLAYGAMKAIREGGLSVPADVAVIGFDDQDTSAFVDPPLTTIRQPIHSIGQRAVELLLVRIAGKDPRPTEPERLKFEPRLVRRASA